MLANNNLNTTSNFGSSNFMIKPSVTSPERLLEFIVADRCRICCRCSLDGPPSRQLSCQRQAVHRLKSNSVARKVRGQVCKIHKAAIPNQSPSKRRQTVAAADPASAGSGQQQRAAGSSGGQRRQAAADPAAVGSGAGQRAAAGSSGRPCGSGQQAAAAGSRQQQAAAAQRRAAAPARLALPAELYSVFATERGIQ